MVFQTFLFVLSLVFSFYIPGVVIVGAKNLSTRMYLYRLFVGWVAFTIVALAAGFIHMRWIVPVYMGVMGVIGIATHRKDLLQIPKVRLVDGLFIVAMTLLFSLTMLRSGWMSASGFSFVGVNGSDGLWHVALVNELASSFPPQHPGFAGIPLTGYHFLYDFVLAELHRVYGVDSIHLVFHFFPLFVAFLWVSGVFTLSGRMFRSRLAAYASAVLSVVGGSFAYVIPLVFHQKGSIDDVLGILQPFTSLMNPQFASSAVLTIFSLLFFYEYETSKQKRWLVFLLLGAGVSVGFKVYAGMILLGGLWVVSVYQLLIKKTGDLVAVAAGSSFLAWLIFGPFNHSYGFLVWQPLWPPHRVMQGPLDFTQWEIQHQTLVASHSWKGLVRLEVMGLSIFFLGNMGTRLMGLLGLMGLKKKFSVFSLFYFSIIAVSSLVPLFFIQPVAGPFNMIQMYWYFLLFLGIVAGGGMAHIFRTVWRSSRFAGVGIAIMFLLATLPSAGEKIRTYGLGPLSYYEKSYVDALQVLAKKGTYEQTTMEIPVLSEYTQSSLDQWFGTSAVPIVPALANKRAFIANETVSFGYESKDRRLARMYKFMHSQDECSGDTDTCLKGARQLLDTDHIRYIVAPAKANWIGAVKSVKTIYTNDQYGVYELLPL